MIVESIVFGTVSIILGSFVFAHKALKAVPMSPELARAKREAIAKKRAIVNERRQRFVEYWEKSKSTEVGKKNWTGICEADKKLEELADEEGNIPIYEGEKND